MAKKTMLLISEIMDELKPGESINDFMEKIVEEGMDARERIVFEEREVSSGNSSGGPDMGSNGFCWDNDRRGNC